MQRNRVSTEVRRNFRLLTLLPAVVGILLAATASVSRAEETGTKDKPSPKTVPVFELNSAPTDKPRSDDPLLGQIGAESLRSLVSRLDQAATDEDVAAVVLLLNGASVNLAHVEELRESLARVTEHKPVYAHADSLTMGSFALLSGATRLSMSPTGDAWITGLYAEQLFLRGLLDKVGVEPDFLTCGDYKSAAETFMRTSPSPEAAEMQNWLYDSLFTTVRRLVAEGRKVDDQQVGDWIDTGLFSAETAQEAQLIDAIETRDELLTVLKKTHGVSLKLDRKYGKKATPNLDLNNPFAILQLYAQLLSGPKTTRSTRNAIAVVHIDGPIMLGRPEASLFSTTEAAYSETVRKTLQKIAEEPRIRGVVLRVNSPGGSATASEIMLQSVMQLQSRKPVVVSMGSVAGSGGYYVACRGERIFADASTITGSIGVVAGKLATSGMWEKVGIHFNAVSRGRNAGLLRSPEPFSADEKAQLQDWMNDVYEVFKKHVVEGREGKLTKPIDELAGGRVYTGLQALELGLVDEIGTLHDAITYLAESAELTEYEVREFPESRSFLEQLMSELTESSQGNDRRLSLRLWETVAPMLHSLDPERTGMIQSALLQLDILNQENATLTMPTFRLLNW